MSTGSDPTPPKFGNRRRLLLDPEPESIAKMDAYTKEHGYKTVGKHHEIYLGDPRRAAPSKLKTVLRHPVARG